MGLNTKIDWADHTWNPWQGCRKVSEACRNCYMFRDKKRYGQDPDKVIRSSNSTFLKPFSKDWMANPGRVFVCSWSDFFIEDADEWRDDAWKVMANSLNHTYLLLTKRPENIESRLPEGWEHEYKNVWLGVTVENEYAKDRIDILGNIPARKRFVSMEPLLESLDISEYLAERTIDWVIVGGESGPNYRRFQPEWAGDLLAQCRHYNVPFFMKQMSGNTKADREAIPDYLNVKEIPC